MVITLSGKPNTGKTTTLKHLIALMRDDLDFEIEYIKNFNGDCRTAKCKYSETKKGNPEEIIAKFIHNGKIIGVTTRGDNLKIIMSDFAKLGKCDIYVCASHNSKEFMVTLRSEVKKIHTTLDIFEKNSAAPFENDFAEYLNFGESKRLYEHIKTI